jgi:hypothetical protein
VSQYEKTTRFKIPANIVEEKPEEILEEIIEEEILEKPNLLQKINNRAIGFIPLIIQRNESKLDSKCYVECICTCGDLFIVRSDQVKTKKGCRICSYKAAGLEADQWVFSQLNEITKQIENLRTTYDTQRMNVL